MNSRQKINEATFFNEVGKQYNLKYFLTHGKSTNKDHLNLDKENDLFGIIIEKQALNSDEIYTEIEDTGWISENQQEVIQIINVLSRNLVTPISLACVVDGIAYQ